LKSNNGKNTEKRSSKRASGSTIGHGGGYRFGGRRWEVVRGYEVLDDPDAGKEEGLDFMSLVGRANALERLLKAGKRVSMIFVLFDLSVLVVTHHGFLML